MNIQRQKGIVSTINFSPFIETDDCLNLRASLFHEATLASSISPKNHLDVYDESILIFENIYQALNFLSHVVRIAVKFEKFSNSNITLRSSICIGDYFIHQDQIYGDAVNLATKLSYSSRENEMLVCGVDSQILENFSNSQNDIAYFTRDIETNCISIGLLDEDSTIARLPNLTFKVEYNNQTKLFISSRNEQINIGRSIDSQILIDSDHVSRNHARITINDDNIYIEDNSANGTYLYFDDREIFLTNDSMTLSSNGIISCGQSMYSAVDTSDIISYKFSDDTH